jgi:hypothetical protein
MDEFTRLFEEHVDGFSGLRKREKSDKGMEWRKQMMDASTGKSKPKVQEKDKTRLSVIEAYRLLKKKKT